jgi:phosphoribosyl 1,2-cyclic phosphate phosphodiesterase
VSLTVTVLGCGTSSGVPRIGNDWGTCDPAEPRNRRTRASVMIESSTTRLLVDTAPDMREQLLRENIIDIDAVLWTHDHADHCHGLDDLRQVAHHLGGPVPGYAQAATSALLARRFSYAFEGHSGYPPIIAMTAMPDKSMIGDIEVRCVEQPHGAILSTGFRFDLDGGSIAYATDFHALTSEMVALYAGVDVWVVDCLREKPHPTHAHMAMTLEAIAAVKPGRAVFTHMDQSMDYRRLCEALPSGIEPGYDGLKIMLK